MAQMMQLSLRSCHATPLLHLHLFRLRFLALDAIGGESLEYNRVRGSQRVGLDYFVCYFIFMHHIYLLCICVRYFAL